MTIRSGKAPRPEYRRFSELNTSELVLASFGNRVVGFAREGGELASFGETVRAVGRTSSIGTNCQRAAHARTPASSSGDAASASRESVEERWRRRGRRRRQRLVFDRAREKDKGQREGSEEQARDRFDSLVSRPWHLTERIDPHRHGHRGGRGSLRGACSFRFCPTIPIHLRVDAFARVVDCLPVPLHPPLPIGNAVDLNGGVLMCEPQNATAVKFVSRAGP